MYEFQFEGYQPQQCEQYLQRIGANYDGNPTLENLDMLIRKHQQTVPFENLALVMNWGTVDNTPEALYKKIVEERRGGFCFELNGAFLLLLKGLGYDAVGVMARVGVPFIGELLRLDHHGIIVRLDGKSYYCDVGMGGPKADWAVEFTDSGYSREAAEPVKTTRHGQTYWVEDTYEGWKMLKNQGSDSDGSVIIFAPVPMLPMDFIANCKDLVGRGDTVFHNIRMVNLCLEDGYIDIKNNTLKISRSGQVTETEFAEEEFEEILKKHFGIIRK